MSVLPELKRVNEEIRDELLGVMDIIQAYHRTAEDRQFLAEFVQSDTEFVLDEKGYFFDLNTSLKYKIFELVDDIVEEFDVAIDKWIQDSLYDVPEIIAYAVDEYKVKCDFDFDSLSMYICDVVKFKNRYIVTE